MTIGEASSIQGIKVLFLGRVNCKYSRVLFSELSQFGFEVTYFESKRRAEKLPSELLSWNGDYILCFRSLFILPKALIDRAVCAAINFHPGPPEYPGSGCINFALYDRVSEYGVTAHLMNENIDNGEILHVRTFPVAMQDDLPTLLAKTQLELFTLCSDFIRFIAIQGVDVINEKKNLSNGLVWKSGARLMRELEALKNIDINVSKDELERIIRATYIDNFPPRIEIHGYRFYLKIDE